MFSNLCLLLSFSTFAFGATVSKGLLGWPGMSSFPTSFQTAASNQFAQSTSSQQTGSSQSVSLQAAGDGMEININSLNSGSGTTQLETSGAQVGISSSSNTAEVGDSSVDTSIDPVTSLNLGMNSVDSFTFEQLSQAGGEEVVDATVEQSAVVNDFSVSAGAKGKL